MGKTTVRADKMINTKVTIKDKNGQEVSVDKVLLVDGGSVDTFVDWENLEGGTFEIGALGGGSIGGGSMTFADFKGGSMVVETEKKGGGDVQNKTCDKIKGGYFNTEHGPAHLDFGEGAKGILGMDQRDATGTDPEKNAAGTVARLARRTT